MLSLKLRISLRLERSMTLRRPCKKPTGAIPESEKWAGERAWQNKRVEVRERESRWERAKRKRGDQRTMGEGIGWRVEPILQYSFQSVVVRQEARECVRWREPESNRAREHAKVREADPDQCPKSHTGWLKTCWSNSCLKSAVPSLFLPFRIGDWSILNTFFCWPRFKKVWCLAAWSYCCSTGERISVVIVAKVGVVGHKRGPRGYCSREMASPRIVSISVFPQFDSNSVPAKLLISQGNENERMRQVENWLFCRCFSLSRKKWNYAWLRFSENARGKLEMCSDRYYILQSNTYIRLFVTVLLGGWLGSESRISLVLNFWISRILHYTIAYCR